MAIDFFDVLGSALDAVSNSNILDSSILDTCIRGASPRDTHGPIVKTGPTAGQNRSRNKNGQWHKKRSDAGKSRG